MRADFNPLPGVYRKCYAIANRAHRGQVYGAHQSYFKAHVLPLAEFFKRRGMWEEACLALIHDTIEDHPDKVTYTCLRVSGVPDNIIHALRCISREPGEAYGDYLRRAMTDPLSWKVKIRDVLFNISSPEAGRRRILKYARALIILTESAPSSVLTKV